MKIQSPWMGRIKGSAGNMTGCKIYDKNVMRAKAFEVNNPNTLAQQTQRNYFAQLSIFCASLSNEQLRTLFPSKPQAMSRRNAITKQVSEFTIMDGNEKLIEYNNVKTLGNAQTAKIEASRLTIEDNAINIEFDANQFNGLVTENSKVLAVVINEEKNTMSFSTEYATPSEELLTLVLPSGWSETDTLYPILLLADTPEVDLSFGSFIIKVRPEKKSN